MLTLMMIQIDKILKANKQTSINATNALERASERDGTIAYIRVHKFIAKPHGIYIYILLVARKNKTEKKKMKKAQKLEK